MVLTSAENRSDSWLRLFVFRDAISFSRAFCRSISLEILSVRSSGRAFNIRARSWSVLVVSSRHPKAALPVTASIRLMPAATLASDSILKTPASPVRLVWVPPQSSLLKSPIETTRTRSPYFSSKSATAPVV